MESLSIAEVKSLRHKIDSIEGYEAQLKIGLEQVQSNIEPFSIVTCKWGNYFYSAEMDEARFSALRELEAKFKLDAMDIIRTEIAKLKKELLNEYGIVWEEK